MPVPGRLFTIADWYWSVGDKSPGAQVYSSASGSYVPLNDSAYVAWQAAGGIRSTIDTESSLGDVLAAAIGQLQMVASTALVIQQKLKQKQLDLLLVANADNVHMVQAGQNSSTTGTGVANYLAAATNNYRSLRAQIAAATTAAQVQAININAGWPANP